MEECAIRLWLCPVCSPNATGGKKNKKKQKSIQEIRTAGEALGVVLEQTKHSPAQTQMSLQFFSTASPSESSQFKRNFSFKLSEK